MADASNEDVVLLQKITAVHKINAEIIDRLKAAKGDVISNSLVPEFSTDESQLVFLKVLSHTIPREQIVTQWVPAEKLQWSSSKQMNLFNDNLDYSVKGFADLARLNDSVFASVEKFEMLDARKSPPILRLFLSNLEIIQQLLGDIESRIVVREQDPEIQKMQQKAEALQAELVNWKKSVLAWNLRNAPALHAKFSAQSEPHAKFSTQFLKGRLELDATCRSISRYKVGHYCVSLESPDLTQVTFEVTSQLAAGYGWVLFGVHPDPLNSTAEESYNEGYGWNLTTTGQNSLTYMQKSTSMFGKALKAGERVTLRLQGAQLSINGPGWQGELTLPNLGPWYFHINTYSASVKIV